MFSDALRRGAGDARESGDGVDQDGDSTEMK